MTHIKGLYYRKAVDIVVDKQYVILVLNQISVQLHKHFANLIYATKRQDLDLCNIELTPILNCLHDQLVDLEKELEVYQKRVSIVVY